MGGGVCPGMAPQGPVQLQMLVVKRAPSEEGKGKSWGDRERRDKAWVWNSGYHVSSFAGELNCNGRAWGSAAPDHILGLASLLRHLSQGITQPMTAEAVLPLGV